jgi:hypothetical protein
LRTTQSIQVSIAHARSDGRLRSQVDRCCTVELSDVPVCRCRWRHAGRSRRVMRQPKSRQGACRQLMGGHAADEEAKSKLDVAFQPVPLSVPTLPQSLLFPEKYGPGRILSGVLKTASLFFVDSSIAVRKPLGVRTIATKFLGNRSPETLVRMSNAPWDASERQCRSTGSKFLDRPSPHSVAERTTWVSTTHRRSEGKRRHPSRISSNQSTSLSFGPLRSLSLRPSLR